MSETARKEILDLYSVHCNFTQIQKIDDFIVPSKLYKYSGINEYLIKNLATNVLSATSPTEFNDLYDSTMHFDNASKDLKRYEEINESSKRLGMKEFINEEMKETLKKRSKVVDEFS